MKVSVIIPVYNTADYLEESVNSALMQKQTGEIILIDDCSTDNSANICRTLSVNYEKVKFYSMPENSGCPAARNKGLEAASKEFVSFLDADDIYLENRFDNAEKIFKNDQTADGVYDAAGTLFETEEDKKNWFAIGGTALTTLEKPVPPEKLFDTLIFGRIGSLQTNAVTFKRSAFNKTGFFEEKLLLTQDTHMWLKMAAVNKILPGDINNPVALRRVHNKNRFAKASPDKIFRYRKILWETLKSWAVANKLEDKKTINIDFMEYFHNVFEDEKKENVYNIKNYIICYFLFLLNNNPVRSIRLLKKLILT